MSNSKQLVRSLAAAGLGLSLTACSLAPSYERPAPPVQEQLVETRPGEAGKPGEAGAAAELATTGWRDFYRDPHLQHLLQQALANNRDLRVAALNVEQVQAQYRIQRAELLPNLAASASGTRQRVPASVSQTGAEYTSAQYTAGLGVAAWELDLFGRVNSLRQSALQQYFATTEARRSVQISLAAQVGEVYFSWAANRTLLDIATDTLERHQASYDMVQRRHERGLASSLDLSQAASAVHGARVNIARYRRQLDQSYTSLELLVGASLDRDTLGAGLALDSQPTAAVPAALGSDVLLQRPDVRQAEHALRAANANIGAARAAFFPRLALTANAGSTSSELNGLFDSGTGSWSFSPQIVLPIFTWGANKAALDISQLRKEASVAQYERVIQTAFKEARDAIQSLSSIQDQLSAQQDLVNASKRSLELATVRYERGVDSFLDVLVSQRSYNAAQQALITARLAQLTNDIALFRALGGGLHQLDSDLVGPAVEL